jgi:hypothetical protein
MREICSGCGTRWTVRSDGRLRSHKAYGTEKRCAGSGKLPGKPRARVFEQTKLQAKFAFEYVLKESAELQKSA